MRTLLPALALPILLHLSGVYLPQRAQPSPPVFAPAAGAFSWSGFLRAHTPQTLLRRAETAESSAAASGQAEPQPRPALARASARAEPQPRPSNEEQRREAIALTDAARYREIFALQTRAEWVMADRLIAELRNRILMGHVLHQRYTHPQFGQASWRALENWLTRYADLPHAWTIYKQAQRAKPARAAMPPPPPERQFADARSANQQFASARAKRIRRTVLRLCRRGYPSGALRYLNASSQRRSLSPLAHAELSLRIAYAYLALNLPGKALPVAQSADAHHPALPMVDWYIGFAAWRLGSAPSAARHFARLADNPHAHARERAKGAYWAARSYQRLGDEGRRARYLAIASDAGVNFYSLLARWQRDQYLRIRWQGVRAPLAPLEALRTAPSVQRALFLLEAGQPHRAELEFLLLLERLAQRNEVTALQLLATQHQLTAIELAAALRLRAMQAEEPTQPAPSLYPLPPGFTRDQLQLDRALVFALIRQESLFRLSAISPAGARGLMQLMPTTAAFVSGNRDLAERAHAAALHEAETNLHIGQNYLSQLLRGRYRVNDHLISVLGAYNAGPTNMRRWKKRAPLADPLSFLESIPIHETRLYVTRVMENMWIYRTRLNQRTPSLAALAQDQWPQYQALDKPIQAGRQAGDSPRRAQAR